MSITSTATLTNRIKEKVFKGHIPLYVLLELTYRCNLRCVHCYRIKEKRRELSLQEIASILGQLAEAGTFILTISGGEPLLRKDFFEISRRARDRGFILKLFSNGTLIDAESARRIRDAGFYEVNVSIYSNDPSVHDRITGIRGSFTRTLAGLRLLKRNGIRMKLKCPLMRLNRHSYAGVIALAGELGAHYVFDPVIAARNDGSKDTLRLRLKEEELLEIFSDPAYYDPALKDAFVVREFANPPCPAGHYICNISPYADVSPCIHIKIKGGSLRRQSFRKIWSSSPQIVRLRKVTVEDLAECASCRYRFDCIRCPGLAKLEDGSFKAASSAACRVARAWVASRRLSGCGPGPCQVPYATAKEASLCR